MTPKRKRYTKPRQQKTKEEVVPTANFYGTISAMGIRCLFYLSSVLGETLKLVKTPM
jgi:hypothetical protein